MFFKLIYGNVLLIKNVENFIKKQKIKNKKFKSFKNKYYNLYKVKNARIYTDNNQNVAIIKKKLAPDELKNYDLFNSDKFLGSLRSILEKTSQINFENLSELKAFPVYVSSSFPSLDKKNIFL